MALVLMCVAVAGCAAPQAPSEEWREKIGTPPITHIVLIQLKDPSRTRELLEDCNRLIPGIPSVLAYTSGTPLPMDRPNIVSDYSVGLFVAFKDDEGYRTYTDHPLHLALVEKWRGAWKDVRVVDFVDPPSTGSAVAPQPAGTPQKSTPAPSPTPPAQAAPAQAAPAQTPPAPASQAPPLSAPQQSAPPSQPAPAPPAQPGPPGTSGQPAQKPAPKPV